MNLPQQARFVVGNGYVPEDRSADRWEAMFAETRRDKQRLIAHPISRPPMAMAAGWRHVGPDTSTGEPRMSSSHAIARRWDPVVKLTHWTIVAAILLNGLITEGGSGPHIWVGYTLAATLLLRLIWGVIGPVEARFSAFPPSPGRAVAHIREIMAGRRTQHASHNPLGALMVYAIWSVLTVIVVTGVMMAAAPAEPVSIPAAAQQRLDRDEGRSKGVDELGEEQEEGPLTEIHETAVNLLYGLIVLHIAGVAFETRRSGRRIVLAMLPGRR